MASLVNAGLVISLRGKHGGFRLAKPPNEIRLSQVIQATEGSLSPVYCVDDPKQCERTQKCVTHDIWEKLKDAMYSTLDSITLENMVEMHKNKSANGEDQMYYI